MTGMSCSHCAQAVITGLDQLGGVTIDSVPGGTFALYVAGYSAFRIFEERRGSTPRSTSWACA